MTNRKPSHFLLPGLYPALLVVMCKSLDPMEGRRQRLYVVEFEIIKSEVTEHEVGQSVAWIMRTGPSLHLFLCEVMCLRFDQVTSSTVNAVFETNNPLHGQLVRCEAREQKTKSGHTFTHYKWVPIALR